MIKKLGARLLLGIIIIIAGTAPAAEKQPASGNPQAKNLFIIVMNAVRYDDAFGNKNHLYTEHTWTNLRPLGTLCTKFYNRELTYPIPAQLSLLTGVWHVFENPLSETICPAVPTLFEYWNRKHSGNTSYFASSKEKLKIITHSNHAGYGESYAPVFATNEFGSQDTSFRESKTEVIENAIYEKAVPYIFKNHPSFVYISLGSGKGDEADRYGGHECKLKGSKDSCGGAELLNAYYESIILLDAIIYDLWDRIQHDGTYKGNSVFIVLSDHGRHTDDFHGYGDDCRGCQQLNFLAIGPGIKKNYVSRKERTLIDICRTVGTLCDIPTPFAKGAIMKEILE